MISTAGLGLGALVSGLITFAIPTAAATTVWLALLVVMIAGTVAAVLTPETSMPRPGAVASLVPRVTVPPRVRRLFASTMPTVVAVFLETALFLGLMPLILASVFHVTTPVLGGAVNFVMFTTATITAGTTGGIHPRMLRLFGNLALVVGAVLILGGIATGQLAFVWLSALVSGLGMGAGFTGSNRGLVPEVEAHQRAGLFTAIFVVAYVTFGASAIVAGFIATAVGVPAMAVGYGIVLAIAALVGLTLGTRAGVSARAR